MSAHFFIDIDNQKYKIMKFSTFVGQVFISALTCVVIIHLATPKYVRDTVDEMECEKEDRLIIQRLDPSVDLPFLSHAELHQKREELVRNYYRQIEAKKEQMEQENLLKDILSEITIPSEEEIAKETERIRQQQNLK